MEEIIVKINGKEHKVQVEEEEGGKLKVHCEGEVYEVETKENIEPVIKEEIRKKGEIHEKKIIMAPLPGIVSEINVKNGDKVKENQVLLKLVAMKMENEITARIEGTIKEIKVKKNDNVNKGDVLILLE